MKIFFDIDGVLINGWHTKPARRNCWNKDLERDLGVKVEHFESIFSGWFLDVLKGRLNLEEELERWLKEHDYDVKAWQVMDYWHKKDSVLNRSVFDVVERLSGRDDIHLYTATNQAHERIIYLKNVLGWKNHFTDFYYSARLGCLKHDPDYFRQIEEELKFDPRQNPPLYFDDDPKNIEVSSARGWNAVLVDGPEDVVNHPLIRSLMAA